MKTVVDSSVLFDIVKGPRERTAPDFLIGAHAIKQANALLTSDAGFFRHYFEGLSVITP